MTIKNTKTVRPWCGRTDAEMLQAVDRLIYCVGAMGFVGLAWIVCQVLRSAWEWVTLVIMPAVMLLISAAALVTCIRWWIAACC